eukprot:3222200-Rhodomonas_salina.1
MTLHVQGPHCPRPSRLEPAASCPCSACVAAARQGSSGCRVLAGASSASSPPPPRLCPADPRPQ